MPQGCRNTPGTHQHHINNVLCDYISHIRYVYLNDIVIWSQTIKEHKRNVCLVLNALRTHSLFCSPKKTDLFCLKLDFLRHHISGGGVKADGKKVEKILAWPTPRTSMHVCTFLGIVRYIAVFLPALAIHTAVLNTLTTKEKDKSFRWLSVHEAAVDTIKFLVTS